MTEPVKCTCGLDEFAQFAGRDPRMGHPAHCPKHLEPTPAEVERSSDVVSQLEAVIAGICERIDHTLECRQHAVALDMQGETPDCLCNRTARVRSEIARTVERMLVAAANSGYSFGSLAAPPEYRERVYKAALGAALPPQTGNPPGIPDVQALSCIAQTGNPPPDLAPIVRDLMSALWTQTRLICTEEDHPRSMRCQSCASRESINRAEAALRGVSSLRAPQSGPYRVHVSEYEGDGFLAQTEYHYFVVRGTGKPACAQCKTRASTYDEGVFNSEHAAEAIAVRDALNALAGSGAEPPPQPDVRLNACQRCGFAPCECDS